MLEFASFSINDFCRANSRALNIIVSFLKPARLRISIISLGYKGRIVGRFRLLYIVASLNTNLSAVIPIKSAFFYFLTMSPLFRIYFYFYSIFRYWDYANIAYQNIANLA